MKLNSKRVDLEYTSIEKVSTFLKDIGLPFFFDVDEKLTDNPSAMDAVGEVLDEVEILTEKAEVAIKAALTDESSPYHDFVTFFMQFHRDGVGPDITADPLLGIDPARLPFIEVADFLRLRHFSSLVDDETSQQVLILDLSFNPEITDELMVVYFNLNKEISCTTHKS